MRGTVKGDRADPLQVHAFSGEFPERLAHGGIPVGGVLLGPALMFVMRGVFHRRLSEHTAGAVDRRDLAAAGTEVDSQQNGVAAHRHFTQLCCGSLAEIRPRLTFPVIVQR